MSTIPQVAEAMQTIETPRAEDLARETYFVQRRSPLSGAVFAQTTVLGWLSKPEASYSHLQQVAASLGVAVRKPAIEQRMTPSAAAFLKRLLAETVTSVVTNEGKAQELFERFKGVYLQDGTVIGLPESLASEWKGCGGKGPHAGKSSLRVPARLNLATGGEASAVVARRTGL